MISLFLFEVNQPIGAFYIGKLKSSILKKITYVNQRRNGKGIQRELKTKRIPEIARFCEDPDAIFPTPIILSANFSDCKINEDNGTGIFKMEFDEEVFKCEILDGQHRLAGIREAKDFEAELPIVFMFDIEDSQKAYVFSTINSNQTKVDRSLIYDLFGVSTYRSPQQTCHEIARIMNTESDSPFYGKLKMLGKKTKDSESLSQGTFINYLMRHISKKEQDDMVALKKKEALDEYEGLIFRNLFINKKEEYIVQTLLNYFNAVRFNFEKEWDDTENFILSKTTGYGALMRALPKIYNLGLEEKNVTEDYFREKFSQVKEKLSRDKKELKSEYFKSGEAGQNELANYILSAMHICPKCGRPLFESQYKKNRTYKSCPKCSEHEGIHIFYKFPEGFGTSIQRETEKNPEGAQSYCIECRKGKERTEKRGILCSDLK